VNAFLKRWLPWTILPLAGGTTFAFGSTWWLGMPRQEERNRIDIEIATLQDEARGLAAAAATPPSMHEDQLPTRRGVGDLASELAERATANGVRIATVDVAVDQGSSTLTPGATTTQPAPAPMPAPAMPPGMGSQPNHPGLGVVTPDRLDLVVCVEGSFDAMVRFLHAVETNPRLTRLVDLRLQPRARLVEATMTVRGYHFAGTSPGAANSAAAMPAVPGGR
jgi:hypothetical protein